MRYEQRWNKELGHYAIQFLNGAPVLDESMPDIRGAIPANFKAAEMVDLSASSGTDLFGVSDIAYRNIYGATSDQWQALADRRGYLLCYEKIGWPRRRLGQVISRDGVHDPEGDWGVPFDDLRSVDLYQNVLDFHWVADKHGIYVINESSGSVQPLIEQPSPRFRPL